MIQISSFNNIFPDLSVAIGALISYTRKQHHDVEEAYISPSFQISNNPIPSILFFPEHHYRI